MYRTRSLTGDYFDGWHCFVRPWTDMIVVSWVSQLWRVTSMCMRCGVRVLGMLSRLFRVYILLTILCLHPAAFEHDG